MDGTQIVVAIIAAVTGGGASVKLVEGIINQRSGKFEQERTRNADILKLRDQAVIDARRSELERREQERSYRAEREQLDEAHRIEVRNLEAELRVLSFHAQLLTRMLIEHGCPPERVPIWPIPPR